MTRRAAVLGSPIAHSLSPLLHRRAYDVLGLSDWTYDAFDVTEAQLPEFVEQMDGSWAGVSLTMPLKSAVLPLLTTSSHLVRAVGAANTVLTGEHGLRGENTDVPGMAAACREAGVPDGQEAAVLGAGATARSALAALAELGCTSTVFARSARRHHELVATAEAVGITLTLRDWSEAQVGLGAPLVINTTPAGVADELSGDVPQRPGVLFDVVYAPWPTPLAAAWVSRGGDVIGGLELLVQQAVRQVALMTGLAIDLPRLVAELRLAGERALRP